MQISQIGQIGQIGHTRSRDVQLLLWAVGEARARMTGREPGGRRPDGLAPFEGAEFFTEWQPATR